MAAGFSTQMDWDGEALYIEVADQFSPEIAAAFS
jgi:hypothetical protein